jgi:hypothetical protein
MPLRRTVPVRFWIPAWNFSINAVRGAFNRTEPESKQRGVLVACAPARRQPTRQTRCGNPALTLGTGRAWIVRVYRPMTCNVSLGSWPPPTEALGWGRCPRRAGNPPCRRFSRWKASSPESRVTAQLPAANSRTSQQLLASPVSGSTCVGPEISAAGLLHHENHFSDVLAIVNVAVRGGHFGQRERLGDHRLDFSGRVHLEKLA